MAASSSETISCPSCQPSLRSGALPRTIAYAMPADAAAPHMPQRAHVAPGTQSERDIKSARSSLSIASRSPDASALRQHASSTAPTIKWWMGPKATQRSSAITSSKRAAGATDVLAMSISTIQPVCSSFAMRHPPLKQIVRTLHYGLLLPGALNAKQPASLVPPTSPASSRRKPALLRSNTRGDGKHDGQWQHHDGSSFRKRRPRAIARGLPIHGTMIKAAQKAYSHSTVPTGLGVRS